MNSLLQSIGQALYGRQWQSDLARDLGIADRTVRRWYAGESAPPEGVMADLRLLCVKRAAELAAIAVKLDQPPEKTRKGE